MNDQYKTRGIRGAITVEKNSSDAIQKATTELLSSILNENKVVEDDIVSVIFTLTNDLTADFPAKAARKYFSWDDIPMICAQEIPVPGSITLCIRVLILINTTLSKKEIKHIYLGEARNLRPDLVAD
ncbi:MAG: chorismate mutase [Candidatus Melainabacteria bacterium RIFOXYA12_FULL_32_12]|nr:MAG: chorismate mutase [Candidatus Melainabacteria bacterium RIFOXYA2_FULL_32_9]OGI31448.1 MAG: chorismate mutase [Candidatus Melainabacteria bacterium RIFOXYA12_FULL_32_12]